MTDHAGGGGRHSFRPRVGSVTLCLLTSLYIVLFTNYTFWTRAHTYLSSDPIAFVAFVVGVCALISAVMIIPSAKYLIKPALVFFVLVASVSSWFTHQFGTIIDREMIRNAAVTTTAEAGHLITVGFATHVILTGILPSLFIIWVRVLHRPFLSKLGYNLAVIAPCLAIFVVAGLSFSRTYAAVGRKNPDLVLTLNPFVPIVSAVKYLVGTERDRNIVAAPIGTDAHRTAPGQKPRVTIIVAGETARAQNFSLGGYGRDTNPELKKQDIVYFPNTTSCGTATATSIPCMFSIYARAEYSHRKGLETQNLLDVLSYAKVNVTWLDNDTGAYGVADRVPYTFLPKAADPRFCKDGECLDAILLDKLDDYLANAKQDSVLVLHQLGSHGPAYYLRYPENFRRFTPDCRAAEFGSCKPEEIVNAYDNSILYTDHIVSEVINRLKAHQGNVAGAMIYVSDHGESLGENGLYLHGAPYVIAPAEQTRVPFLVWLAGDLQASAGFDMACLLARAGASYSHDNFFHSVLGLMDIGTKVYDPALDIFASCRKKVAGAPSPG
ncbi:phosphoethanolamine--lipid A transferase [Rhizobium sp. VS19-DR104.2]|uniref:phosphoethanolamine transferase n=1 Tax=unclassified Rhizobium TaxID=2613769 RepID=UPI001C5B3773|nr:MULTISPECIES: phosphoethanolamine--lipid A transferase [unclassified Rhizobium]MBZ5761448.1 phosphoethanolamine--lipid A transferase [Rhizobium sp. VS19-DR96]MBZ5767396.1 phosphoethanolamine--lipid A transferase [Rhizobium sp. VS19-DR129.2]MBZ5775155.1 phosphoethanolamine--lipid A transferase [Rhizobium sp. VS19-DRK62.2]MBZ5785880.1 phosphoethanolamine--lipid A transferase [Rhizobium sp. VS19-DR121]MBZ5803306.1 phosphoethanolamine--lipid A transferase [Rhizobium sp. VS19-DR181]